MRAPSLGLVASPAAHPRALLLLPAGLSMLAGTAAALHLLGLGGPHVAERWAAVHGPLMVLAFVGTVVALERAVALRSRWGYSSPALLGAGGLLLLSPAAPAVGRVALLAGTLALLGVSAGLWRRAAALPLAVQQLGAVCGTMAAALWVADAAVPFLAPWLVGFLVLTVLGERLELGAVGRAVAGPGGVGTDRLATVLAAAYVVAASAALAVPGPGYVVLGAVLLALVATVARDDVARRTVRASGQTRFMAVAMLAGYAWLLVAGGVWLVAGPAWQGPAYDAVLHAVFLGFVLSMVMAHAPVILPAVVRRPLPYRPAFYGPLVLLHASLVVRVLVGDAWGVPEAVLVGGVLNVVALLAFVALAAAGVVAGPRPGVRTSRAARAAGVGRVVA